MKTRLLIWTLAFLFFPFLLSAQHELQWGIITEAEWALERCSFDTTASVVVLNKEGEIQVDAEYIGITVHKRMKILDEKGLEAANVELLYYFKSGLEQITSIRAQTLNKNGSEVEILELDKSAIFDKDLSEFYKAKSFTFPGVKVGSIIEFRYVLETRNYTSLDNWVFQDAKYPTLHNSLEFHPDDRFSYAILRLGSNLQQKYAGQEETRRWVLTDLPAFEEEDFVYNYLDYADQLQFQLHAYRISNDPYSGVQQVITSWEDVGRQVRDLYNPYLRKRKYVRELFEGMKLPETDDEKVEVLYQLVQDKISWNGKYRALHDRDQDETLAMGTGSSAEMNLFLIQLLREAGLKAYPILISTREAGKVLMSYPVLNQFNHVIAAIKKEDGSIQLVDAVYEQLPLSMLPLGDYNYFGLMLEDEVATWLEFPIPPAAAGTYFVELDLTDPAGISGRLVAKFDGYEAYYKRQTWKAEGWEALFGKEILLEEARLAIENANAKNLEDPYKSFIVETELTASENPFALADFIYLDVDLLDIFSENPFTASDRYFPVEIPYPITNRLSFRVKLPEGMQVESMPTASNQQLGEQDGQFLLNTTQNGNAVNVQASRILNRIFFAPDEYALLKEFYEVTVEAVDEPIVVKK